MNCIFSTALKKYIVFPLVLGALMLPLVVRADSLLHIYSLALKNDPKLEVARHSLKAGLEFKKAAFGTLLPQLSVSASHSVIERETAGEFPITLDQDQNPLTAEIRALRYVDNIADERAGTWGVSLNQVLFDASTWFEYRKGYFQSEKAQAQFSLDQQDLLLRVVHAYFSALRAKNNLSVSVALERAERELLSQTAKLKTAGVNSNIDVFQAEAALEVSTAQRMFDEELLRERLLELSFITGVSHDDVWSFSESFRLQPLAPGESELWVRKARESSLQVRVARLAQKVAQANASSARAEHYPKVNAALTYTDATSDNHEVDNGASFDFESRVKEGRVTVSVSMPLYSGGSLSANRRQAKYEFHTSIAQYESTAKEVEQLTAAAYLSAVSGQNRITLRQQVLAANQKALNAVKRGLEVGARGLPDVLLAQKNYYAVKRELSSTEVDILLSVTELKFLTGVLSPSDIVDLNQLLLNPLNPSP